MRRLIDSGAPHEATTFYWAVCRSDLTFQPDSSIFKLLCEGYGQYYMSISRSKAGYWLNGPIDPLEKPLYSPLKSDPSRETDAQHLSALLTHFEEKNIKLDDLMCSWLLVASIYTLKRETVEQYFSSWLQAAANLPVAERTQILDSIVYALLDRDFTTLIRIVHEKESHQLSSHAMSAIIAWYADQDDINSALALLDHVVQESTTYHGSLVTFGFLFRYCQRKKDVKMADMVLNRLKKLGITLTSSIFNDVLQVYMNAGDVEGALDVYDDMLASKIRADSRTNQILGDVWRR